jgi:hypothetical protein
MLLFPEKGACHDRKPMRIFLLIGILVNVFHAYAQLDLKKNVSADFDNARIEEVLEWLKQNQGIKLSYGFDNVQHEMRISVHARNSSVLEIIHAICKQASLIFVIIDSTVVFKYLDPVPNSKQKPETKRRNVLKGQSPQDSANLISIIQDSTVSGSSLSDSLLNEPLISESGGEPKDSILAIHPSGTSRQKQNIQSGLFISYAFDFNKFNFTQRDIASQQFSTGNNSSYCLGGYIVLSRKLFASLGITHVTKDFYLNYNYKVLDLSDPFPIPDKTFIKLHYIELPLSVAYHVTTWKKISFLGSFGLYPAFLVREQETTTYQNSSDTKTSYFLNANKSSICSASLGAVLSFQFNSYSALFIESGYSLVFDPVNDQAMSSNSSLLRLKTGIQYSLSSHK